MPARRPLLIQPPGGSSPIARFRASGALFGVGTAVPFGGTFSNSTAPILAASGQAGLAWQNTASLNGAIATSVPSVSSSSFTIIAIVEFASSGSLQAIVDRDINTLRSFQFRRKADSTIELIRFNTAVSSVVSATTVGTVPAGAPTAVVAVVRGLNHAIFLGKEIARASITGTPQVFDGVLGLAATWGGTAGTAGYPASLPLDGKLYAYAALPFAISEADAQALAQSPAEAYSRMSRPMRGEAPLVVAGSGPSGTSSTTNANDSATASGAAYPYLSTAFGTPLSATTAQIGVSIHHTP